MGCTTSASSRKVTVSDQLRAETMKRRRSGEKFSNSILVNGHGPAMQETLALRNSLPSPASRESEPIVAFHFPPGAHGSCLLHGTFALLTIWKVFTALPIFASVVALTEYLIRVFEIAYPVWDSGLVSWRIGIMRTI